MIVLDGAVVVELLIKGWLADRIRRELAARGPWGAGGMLAGYAQVADSRWRGRFAPFPLHLFVFHPDGTVLQSNPDAGDPNTSDSNAMGVWRADGGEVKGKLVEIMADRTTHRLVSRGEISFSVRVSGDVFRGAAGFAVGRGCGLGCKFTLHRE